MKKAIHWFLLTYMIFFVFGIVLLILINQGDVVILFNKNRQVFLDYFFRYWTYLGDGIFVALLIVILLFVRYGYALVLTIIGIGQAIVSLVLKKWVFGPIARPTKYFEGIYELDLIEGIKMNKIHSFPSGHTMTAFSIAAFICIISKKRYLGVVWCFYALLVGASRIYTLQHFYRDTLAGSLLGILITMLVYKIFENKLKGDWLIGSLRNKK